MVSPEHYEPGKSVSPASTGHPLAEAYQFASSQFGVPVPILLAITKQESDFNPAARSPVGAIGMMQLMPGTAAGLGVTNPSDPLQNIVGGAKYLSQLYAQFHDWPKAIAAYNAGPEAVRKANGVPNFPETQGYVRSVLGMLQSP